MELGTDLFSLLHLLLVAAVRQHALQYVALVVNAVTGT